MTEDTLLPFGLPAAHRKKVTVDFNGGNQSSDGGLLLLRAERKLGVCERLAAAIPDRRDPDRIQHSIREMLMERVSAIVWGHDLGRLRHDPLMKLAVGRCPETGEPLASLPTISRHVGSGAPVAMILRPACTPNGTEVRTVVKHVTELLQERGLAPALCGAATSLQARRGAGLDLDRREWPF